jgi:separase
MQALRLWHSAIELMQKFTVNHAPRVEERNPFQMEDLAEALPEAGEANSRSGGHNNPGPSGWNWVLAEGLYDTYLSLSKYQMDKGNYRDAEYFILQAHELANSLNATTSVVQALCFQAELAIHLGHYDDAHELLRKGEQYNHQVRFFFHEMNVLSLTTRRSCGLKLHKCYLFKGSTQSVSRVR